MPVTSASTSVFKHFGGSWARLQRPNGPIAHSFTRIETDYIVIWKNSA